MSAKVMDSNGSWQLVHRLFSVQLSRDSSQQNIWDIYPLDIFLKVHAFLINALRQKDIFEKTGFSTHADLLRVFLYLTMALYVV